MNHLWTVTYEVGDPEWGVSVREGQTVARSCKQAINNMWYRAGKPDCFRVLSIKKEVHK